jgi:hypothetical protein
MPLIEDSPVAPYTAHPGDGHVRVKMQLTFRILADAGSRVGRHWLGLFIHACISAGKLYGPGSSCGACPALGSYGRLACLFASSTLSWRASALRLSLDPLTPALRSARRDTGFPAAASSRAMPSAWTFCWRGDRESGPWRGWVVLPGRVGVEARSFSRGDWSGPWSLSRGPRPAGPSAGPRQTGPGTARWRVQRTGCPGGPQPWRRRAACGPARSPWPGPGPAGRTPRW